MLFIVNTATLVYIKNSANECYTKWEYLLLKKSLVIFI